MHVSVPGVHGLTMFDIVLICFNTWGLRCRTRSHQVPAAKVLALDLCRSNPFALLLGVVKLHDQRVSIAVFNSVSLAKFDRQNSTKPRADHHWKPSNYIHKLHICGDLVICKCGWTEKPISVGDRHDPTKRTVIIIVPGMTFEDNKAIKPSTWSFWPWWHSLNYSLCHGCYDGMRRMR